VHQHRALVDRQAVLIVELARRKALKEEESDQEEDPEDSFERLYGQVYNGGLEQLITNENYNFQRVLHLIDHAGLIATASEHWPAAKELLMRSFRMLKRGFSGGRDAWGNRREDWDQRTLDQVSEIYGPLMDVFEKVHKDLQGFYESV
jgi:hypothetical protein